MSMRSLSLALCVAATLAGCKESSSRTAASTKPLVGGVGRLLVAGRIDDPRVSPDYRFATFLKDAQKPPVRGVSPKVRVGTLEAVSLSDGTLRKLGEGVTNAPGGYLVSPDARWVLLLEGYNMVSQAGVAKLLDLTRPEAKALTLGQAVTFFAFSPDSKHVALVDDGVLKLSPVGQDARRLGGEVSTATFSQDSKTLVFRRKLSAGAALLVAKVGGTAEPLKVSDGVVAYTLSPDSARVAFTKRSPETQNTVDLWESPLAKPAPHRVAEGTSAFAFSPDGKWLGRTEAVPPGGEGKLVVGPANGGPGKPVGEKVSTFQFAPTSNAVAALGQWNERTNVGKLTVATLPDVTVDTAPERARDLTWDPTGRFIAYSAQVLKPMIAINLYVYSLGTKTSRKVGDWVYGWTFAPKDHYLLFRTDCQREGRACDLDLLDLTKEAEAKKVLSAVYTFQPSPDAQRLLFTYARLDSETFDAATFDVGKKTRLTLDERTNLPTLFAAEDGSRALYVVPGGAHPGLYLAPTAGGVVED